MRIKRGRTGIYLIIFFAILIGGLGGGVVGYWVKELPQVESLEYYKPNVVTQLYDNSGEPFAQFFSERRIVLKRYEIPDLIIKTLLAAEDADFYQHRGFDIPGILRAALIDLKTMRISQGASTITQQAARLLFLTTARTFSRKIKEAVMTVKLERRYSKDEIITMYLNQYYFGHGAYGIESAARTFFNKSVSDVTLPEAALLCSVMNNPTLFSPFKNPENAINHRNMVLGRMEKIGYIDKATYEEAIKSPLGVSTAPDASRIAPYYVEEIRKTLYASLGNDKLYRGGLNIYTTLDQNHQRAADLAVQNGLNEFRKRHPESDGIQASLVSIRIDTGEITSMVGGDDFSKTKFNRAVQSKRQSGSAIKPFVYLTALMQGYQPSDIIVDAPVIYKDPNTKKIWKPQNYTRKFYGPTTLRVALENSYNIVTVKLLEKVGISSVQHTAQQAGLKSELPPYLSMGLGSGEVTLLELVNAYATLGSMGLCHEPFYVKRITDQDDNLILKHSLKTQEVFDARYCFQITSILEGAVTHGTCWRAKRLSRPVAAKTGTYDDYTNAWFIGYTPSLAVGVWVGYDLKKTMGRGETGSFTAGPIFVDFLEKALAGTPVEQFPKPDGIELKRICRETGFLANKNCPDTVEEAFISGSSPLKHCELH